MNAERVIKTCLEARIPVVATGPPGTGKTGWGLALRDEGWSIVQVIASVREPTDIGGWPMRTDDGVTLEPGAWAVEAMARDKSGERVVIMFDELRTVTAPQQGALLKVIHERLVGDTQMPRSITYLAFANSVEDSAGGVPLEPPMANRFVHVPWQLDAGRWVKDLHTYAPQSELEAAAMERLGNERNFVASFINKREELLLSIPKDEQGRDGAWPSPRTWDYAAHLWAAANTTDWQFKEELLAGCVGLHAAGEFITWMDSADLPDPEDVIEGRYDKSKLVNLDRPDRTYAILSGIVAALERPKGWTGDRWVKVWETFSYCTKQGASDIAAALVTRLMQTQANAGQNSVPHIAKYVMPFKDLLDRASEGGGWS